MRRMKLIIAGLLIAALLVISPFAANAAPISRVDFDASAVEFGFDGVTTGQIIVPDGNLLTVRDGEVRTLARGDLVTPTYYDGNDASVIRMDFTSPISAIETARAALETRPARQWLRASQVEKRSSEAPLRQPRPSAGAPAETTGEPLLGEQPLKESQHGTPP